MLLSQTQLGPRPMGFMFRVLLFAGLLMGPAAADDGKAFPLGPDGAEVTVYPPVLADRIAYRLMTQTSVGNGPPPLVFYIGGSEGGFPGQRDDVPAAFMRAGYSVATIGYFGFEGASDVLSEISLDAVAVQIQAAMADYRTKSDGAACSGVVGVSKGAEMSLLLASSFDLADAYVANVPSHVAWQGTTFTIPARSSWTLNGKPVPFVSYPLFSKAGIDAVLGRWDLRALHEAGLRREKRVAAARIPVEKINVPVLLMSGRDDDVWPSYEMSLTLLSDLEARGTPHQISHQAYDRDHALFDESAIIADAIAYMDSHLRAGQTNCLSGR